MGFRGGLGCDNVILVAMTATATIMIRMSTVAVNNSEVVTTLESIIVHDASGVKRTFFEPLSLLRVHGLNPRGS